MWLIKALFIELHRQRLAKQVQAWKPGEAKASVLYELNQLESIIRRHS